MGRRRRGPRVSPSKRQPAARVGQADGTEFRCQIHRTSTRRRAFRRAAIVLGSKSRRRAFRHLDDDVERQRLSKLTSTARAVTRCGRPTADTWEWFSAVRTRCT